MAHIFEITASPEKTVALGTDGTGEVAFTVTNVSGAPVKGRAVFGPEKSTALQWLKLIGEPERLIQPRLSDTFVVKVAVPPGTKVGDYSFRLDAISVARPDEDSTEGPTIAIPVALAAPPPRPFPWWILVAAALAIGALSVAALKLIPGKPTPVVNANVTAPDLSKQNLVDGEVLLTAGKLKLGTVDYVVSDVSNVDLILKQSPAPRAEVPSGSSVDVQVGVAIVAVPHLKGLTLPDAQKALTGAHLDPGEITPANPPGVRTPGQVLDSSPPEGNLVQSHQKVALTVQAGTVTVPSFAGQPLVGAQAILATNNLILGAVTGLPFRTVVTSGFPPRVVVEPNMVSDWSSKGQSVPVGTAINLSFPGGPALVNEKVVNSFSTSKMARFPAMVPKK